MYIYTNHKPYINHVDIYTYTDRKYSEDLIHSNIIARMIIAPNSRARKGEGGGEGGVWRNLRGAGEEC